MIEFLLEYSKSGEYFSRMSPVKSEPKESSSIFKKLVLLTFILKKFNLPSILTIIESW